MATPVLHKRATGWYFNGSIGGARWAFFALFILFIIFLIFYTFRVNRRRTSAGKQPLRGTAWMTPPNYLQSQTQYNQPRNDNYVPTYTETANNYDAGHYDAEGNFHPNPNYVASKPPGVVSDETEETVTSPELPGDAHVNTVHPPTFNLGNAYDDADELEMGDFYRRPSGAPPNHIRNVSMETPGEGSSSGSTLPNYAAPAHPPPSHGKN